MEVKVCPKCGKHNSNVAWKCINCGEMLSVENILDEDSDRFLSEMMDDEKEQNNPDTNRTRDLVYGFIGWVIFHNLYFLLGMGAVDFGSIVWSSVFAVLPFFLGLLVVIFIKRAWVGVGGAIAILISTLIWISYGLPLLAFLLPFPAGGFLLVQ